MFDANFVSLCRQRWNRIAKPLGSLGKLEDIVCCLAGIQHTLDVRIDRRVCLVMCADNGVVAEGVTQTDASITAMQSARIAQGQGSINIMARVARCDVMAVDVGINTDLNIPEILTRKAGYGTGNIAKGPAMTEEQLQKTLRVGMDLVSEAKAKGYQIICTGEMGIGNTTTTSAVASVLLGIDPEHTTSRGAGLSDAGIARKLNAIRRAISVNQPDAGDARDVLRKLGGFDIAALTGIFLGGYHHRMPIVMDGVISCVAALLATRMEPGCRDYLLASHQSREPAAHLILAELKRAPLLHADMALGEGTGAVALLPLIDMALAVYHQERTFEQLNMTPYVPSELQTL